MTIHNGKYNRSVFPYLTQSLLFLTILRSKNAGYAIISLALLILLWCRNLEVKVLFLFEAPRNYVAQ